MEPLLIELTQNRAGFSHFIGSWVFTGPPVILIDIGPTNSIPGLVAFLKAVGVESVDYVLLTHIHIDHAGGTARFLEHFPTAKIICHEKGVGHLVNPEKLEANSRKILGDLVDTYGPFKPVKPDYFIPHHLAEIPGLQIIETPGHAVHHLCFSYKGHLFAGEAAGIRIDAEGSDYTRPATPPVFFLQEFVNSIDRLLELEDQYICFAHYGKCEGSHLYLKRAREQILHWEDIIRRERASRPVSPVESYFERLLDEDPLLEVYKRMPEDIQARERIFIGHAIEGYLGYLSRRIN